MTRRPSVLFGRDRERRRLLDALSDPAVRLATIRGPAGAGKTALALDCGGERAHGALLGLGKHPLDASGRSLRPLGAALNMLLSAALEDLVEPELGVASLRSALGASLAALTPLGVERLGAADAAEAPPLTSGAAAERLRIAVVRFLAWLQGFGRPVMLVLDDWGRAAPAAVAFYDRLARDPALASVTVVGTERWEEPSDASADLTLDLEELEPADLAGLGRARLDGDAVAAAAVMGLLGPAADTPLAVLQGIASLVAAGALTGGAGGWTLDRGLAAAALGGRAADTLVRRMQEGEPRLFRLLAGAAVFGDGAPLGVLADVAGVGETAIDDPAVAELLGRQGARVSFRHDTIREATLRAVDDGTRGDLALAWSQRLAGGAALAGEDLAAALRLRLQLGIEGVDPSPWTALFLRGAAEARAVGAAGQARASASAALALEDAAGAPSFAAAREAMLAALQSGDLRAAGEFAGLMAERATGEGDRLAAAEAETVIARLDGREAEALQLGRAALAPIGIDVPQAASPPRIVWEVLRLRATSDAAMPGAPALPPSAYRLMNTIGALAFERAPAAAAVMAARAARFPALRGGAYAASLRALLACLAGDWKGAVQWGRAAEARLEPGAPLQSAAMLFNLQFGHGLALHARARRDACLRLRDTALEEGDLGVAAYAVRDLALASQRLPITLAEHRRTLAECRTALERFDDGVTLALVRAVEQMAINLGGEGGGGQPWRLQGETFDSPAFERDAPPELARAVMACLAMEAALANAFGAWETGAGAWRRMGARFDTLRHHPVTAFWSFHSGLARARLGMAMQPWERFAVAREGRFNPALRHRDLALRAEAAFTRRRAPQGLALYGEAVDAADVSGFRLEHGIVAAAAAAAAREAGRPEAAHRFDAAAKEAWTRLEAWALLPDSARATPAAPRSASPSEVARRDVELAQQASRAKTQLLAGAAHELRTPMQGIQGLLDLAAEDPATLDMPRLQSAFAGLRTVVDDLTDYGAVETERLSVVEEPFDPMEVVARELRLAAPEAAARGVVLRLDAPGPPPGTIAGDGIRTGQVLRNLLANAVRYGAGEIVLEVGGEDERLRLSVSDRGPGLSAADLTRVFQPFVRGDASGKAQGSGLGLALSHQLARRMGGELTAANREGGGAVFTLDLPHRPTAAAAPRAPERPLRILLAEDVALARETLEQLLRRRGHTVVAAADGPGALAAGRAQPFDLLILDVRMPGLTGPEVLARLRAEGVDAPALVMSAAVEEEVAEALADLGAARLVRKPLAVDSLVELIGGLAPAGPPPGSGEVERALAGYRRSLEQALAAGDLASARETAHAAAGLALQFARDDAAPGFAAVEACAKCGDLAGAREALNGL